jgi:hypothetical protein
VLQGLPDVPPQTIATGIYRDVLRRRDGVWTFAQRVTDGSLRGDLSRHLPAPARPAGGPGQLSDGAGSRTASHLQRLFGRADATTASAKVPDSTPAPRWVSTSSKSGKATAQLGDLADFHMPRSRMVRAVALKDQRVTRHRQRVENVHPARCRDFEIADQLWRDAADGERAGQPHTSSAVTSRLLIDDFSTKRGMPTELIDRSRGRRGQGPRTGVR